MKKRKLVGVMNMIFNETLEEEIHKGLINELCVFATQQNPVMSCGQVSKFYPKMKIHEGHFFTHDHNRNTKEITDFAETTIGTVEHSVPLVIFSDMDDALVWALRG